MTTRRGTAALGAALTLFGAGIIAAAQVQLPDDAGKAELVKVCGRCHEPQRAASVRLTREGWESTIDDMISRGAQGTDAEFQAVLDYLSKHFKGEAAKPMNVNTATAVQLESVLLLLRSQAAAVLDYRAKHGPFTSIDDLKKVPGIDLKKIDAHKDSLYFGGAATPPRLPAPSPPPR
jgi:competence protein ComEA